jgi:nucleoside-diphosphate-sugar epimerase
VTGRVLITGDSGFTGSYLRSALTVRGYDVIGLNDNRNGKAIDLLDADTLDRFCGTSAVDHIIHLAAISFVAHEQIADIYRVNVIGSLNLLRSLSRQKVCPQKIILASSANIYGRPSRIPVDELAPPAPLSHYGVSKYSMELMARIWFDRLPILIVRPFNYTGVGQSTQFVFAKLVKHFRDRASEIELGDTSVVREFMDVRDVAEIYANLLESAAVSEAVNICSGQGYRLDEIIERLQTTTGLKPLIQRRDALVRVNDIPELVGSPQKLRSIVNRFAFRPLEETLAWMIGTSAQTSA